MRAARLLPEGEDHPERAAAGKRDARRAWPPIAQQEVEAQERESGGRMRPREAARARQMIGSVGEQPDVGPRAPESGEIPGAIHVRGGLQCTDDARGEHDGKQHIGCAAAPRPQRRPDGPGQQHEQCAGGDGAHQIAAALVQQCVRPPLPGPEPAARVRIVEAVSRDPVIRVREDDRRMCSEKQRARQERVREQEAAQAGRPGYSYRCARKSSKAV